MLVFVWNFNIPLAIIQNCQPLIRSPLNVGQTVQGDAIDVTSTSVTLVMGYNRWLPNEPLS